MSGGRVDLEVELAEPGTDLDGLASVAGRDAVLIALEGHECLTRHDPLLAVLSRERKLRQREQRLRSGELADRA